MYADEFSHTVMHSNPDKNRLAFTELLKAAAAPAKAKIAKEEKNKKATSSQESKSNASAAVQLACLNWYWLRYSSGDFSSAESARTGLRPTSCLFKFCSCTIVTLYGRKSREGVFVDSAGYNENLHFRHLEWRL